MTVKLLDVDLVRQITDAEGKLTLEGVQIIQRMQDVLRDHEERLVDHEARIVALEP